MYLINLQDADFKVRTEKCFIDEIDNLVNIEYCSEQDIIDNTVNHQGVCTAENGKAYTCEHGHWSGTDSSVGMK
jgi:sulfatase maturation enzyme AslB (radical SAM superfamily)